MYEIFGVNLYNFTSITTRHHDKECLDGFIHKLFVNNCCSCQLAQVDKCSEYMQTHRIASHTHIALYAKEQVCLDFSLKVKTL